MTLPLAPSGSGAVRSSSGPFSAPFRTSMSCTCSASDTPASGLRSVVYMTPHLFVVIRTHSKLRGHMHFCTCTAPYSSHRSSPPCAPSRPNSSARSPIRLTLTSSSAPSPTFGVRSGPRRQTDGSATLMGHGMGRSTFLSHCIPCTALHCTALCCTASCSLHRRLLDDCRWPRSAPCQSSPSPPAAPLQPPAT